MALDEISQSVLENYNQLDLRLYRQFVGGFIRGFSPIQKLSYDADTPENAIPALVYQA
jgi:hypothetical protein